LIDGFRVYVLSCMNWRLFIYIFFHGFSWAQHWKMCNNFSVSWFKFCQSKWFR
jgi:hypothetical protein